MLKKLNDIVRRDRYFKIRIAGILMYVVYSIEDIIIRSLKDWRYTHYIGNRYVKNPLPILVGFSLLTMFLTMALDLYFSFVVRKFRNIL